MTNIVETPTFEAGIYQLETNDPVLGGADGISNFQAKQLANRTAYLKAQVEAAQGGLTTHEAAADPHPVYLTSAEGDAKVAAAVAALVASSPAALDTLNELANALGNDPNFAASLTAALGGKQPLDATLTALAAIATAADKLIYATGADTFATTTLSAFIRTLLDDADAAAACATLGAMTQAQADGRYGLYVGDAAGTADALTATVATPITALYDGMLVMVDAAAVNATTTPNFNLTLGSTATGVKTITKLNGIACNQGDIAGAGHRLMLGYSLGTNTWLLCNPALGAFANAAPVTASSGTVTTNNASVTTGTFTAPSKGKLVIYGFGCSNGATASGISMSASLGALTTYAANISSNLNANVIGTLAMNAGQATTVTVIFNSTDTSPKWTSVQTFFLPNA